METLVLVGVFLPLLSMRFLLLKGGQEERLVHSHVQVVATVVRKMCVFDLLSRFPNLPSSRGLYGTGTRDRRARVLVGTVGVTESRGLDNRNGPIQS